MSFSIKITPRKNATGAIAHAVIVTIGNIPPAEAEERYYAMIEQPAMAAWLKRNSLRQTRGGSTGAIAHAVIVTIDDHETVLTFESKEDAERFAHVELARLVESGKHA
jgi:hypothetical protein